MVPSAEVLVIKCSSAVKAPRTQHMAWHIGVVPEMRLLLTLLFLLLCSSLPLSSLVDGNAK